MGDRSAGTNIILGVFLYYIFIFFIMGTMTALSVSWGFDILSEDIDYSDPDFLKSSHCDLPRFDNTKFDNDFTAKPLINNGFIFDEISCISYEGLSWVQGFNWFGLVEATYNCEGEIDSTFYNDGVTPASVVLWTQPNGTQVTRVVQELYTLTVLQDVQIFCEDFGFTWTENLDTNTNTDVSDGNIFKKVSYIKQFSTLSLDFGFETEVYNIVLNLILSVFPLLLLGFAIYLLVR